MPRTNYDSRAITSDHLHVVDRAAHYKLADSDSSGPPTAQFTLINGLAVGTGVHDRTGRSIILKKLMCRWHIFMQEDLDAAVPSGVIHPMTCAVIILKDTTPGAGTPVWSDVFSQPSGLNLSESPLAFLNTDNSGRFKILYRQTVYIGGNSKTPVSTQDRIFSDGSHLHDDVYLNIDEKVRYDGAGATAADIFDGAFYLVTVPQYHFDGSTPNTDLNRMTFEAVTRINYADL